MLTAGLMVTSAALGFSARSLVAALSERREEDEQPAWQLSAAESSIDRWRTPPDESITESSIASDAEALNLEASGSPAVPREREQLSSPSPEKQWEAAWRGFEPPSAPAADSGRQPVMAEPWWPLLGPRRRRAAARPNR